MDKIYLVDSITWARLRYVAGRLCGGSDQMRDEGNTLLVLLDRASELDASDLAAQDPNEEG